MREILTAAALAGVLCLPASAHADDLMTEAQQTFKPWSRR
jgi:hypothetical protein